MRAREVSQIVARGSGASALREETDVTLRDGGTATVRPIGPEDEPALTQFYTGLSASSRTLRFHGALGDGTLAQLARDHCQPSDPQAFGIIATTGSDGIIAHAMYAPCGERRAEIAFAIADAHQ